MNDESKVGVLFVCMGNICRSPTAEGVFRHYVESKGLIDYIHIESAGTHAYHLGEPPDPRAQKTASQRGVDLSYIRARKVLPTDIEEFDYVLAMDSDNYQNLLRIAPENHQHKIKRLLEFAQDLPNSDVPDPYYGGNSGFDKVFDMIEAACEGLLKHIQGNLR
jgi:protein-tyrosine phosphatase